MTDQQIPLYLLPDHDCSYLPDQTAKTLFVDPELAIHAPLYQHLSAAGFRRSGSTLYRPQCDRCNACVPSRVRVRDFTPTRSQRRVQKKNQALKLEYEPARFTPELFSLYQRYIAARHSDGSMHPADEAQFRSFLLCPWAETFFLCAYLEEKLVSVAVTDQLTDGLSAIYTFFDATLAHRSLGTLAILSQVALARELGFGYLYLGYAIEASQKMRYKFDFQPLEVLTANGWQRHPGR